MVLYVSLGGPNSGQLSSFSLRNLGSVNTGSGRNAIEDRGNQGLGVERWVQHCRRQGQRADRSQQHSDLLVDTLSIDIRVSTRYTTIGVPNLLLGRVDVGIAIVGLSSGHWGSLGDWSGSSNSGDRGGHNLDSLGSNGGHSGGSIGVSMEGTSIRTSKSGSITGIGSGEDVGHRLDLIGGQTCWPWLALPMHTR